jgi:hypothetical protein
MEPLRARAIRSGSAARDDGESHVNDFESGRARRQEAMPEGQVNWARGMLIVASMVGVVLLFFVVLSLLQLGTRESPEIRGLAPLAATAATATPARAAAATATSPAAGAPPEITATVREAPNVHTGPGVDYQIIGNLQNGSTVTVIGRSADGLWLQVILPNGQRGWSSTNYLTVAGGIGNVPVTQ